MTSSLSFWIAAAVLLFWSVGAYNRLVRLRSEAIAAFAVVDQELSRQVELVRQQLPRADAAEGEGGDAAADEPSFWAGLHGAATQFAAALAAARPRPLEPDGIAALGAAQQVLMMAWERAEREDAHDLAGPRLPESVTGYRAQLALQAHGALEQFARAVAQYNAAIAQFPASLLAWLFGFRPARAL